MAVLIVGHVHAGSLDVLWLKVMEHTFSDNDCSVRNAEDLSLDDRGKGQLDDLVNGDRGVVEHLRDDGHRAMCGLADSEGKVTCAAAHGGDEKPVT